ncbi:uncharacterized protein LOC117814660 [Notolabrus celidotus]|uniref:uncharacterized protein LOC117814660 n=1 Tax=Notolabrus celidotus TaxID=1203425 RepID=UPI00148F50D9|nr:uncharacterized protein LOC117814660 [Notolabrus celidotus]
MSEQRQISDFSQMDEKPESMKETFIPPEFSTNPAQMMNLAVSGIVEELMNCEDLFQDKDLTSHPSSTPKDKESSCSLSQSSLGEDRVSITTSVWSSPDSDISERISPDVQSEESRRASSTDINKMSDFSQTDKEADELMECDNLLEDEAMNLHLDLSFLNEERSHTLSGGSLSWDSRTTCNWSDRPTSSASSSSAYSAMSKATEEDVGTMTGINAPVEVREVHPEEIEDKIQAPNSGRSSPSALQEDTIPSPQSQTKAGSVIQMQVRSFSRRPLDDDSKDSSSQEEAEAGEVKQTEASDSAPASSKTTISTRGRFFRWLKKNKIQPVDVSIKESIQSSNCPPETCSSIEEDTRKVSAETKTKKGNGFIRFFRSIFSKNEKKLKKKDKTENGKKKTSAERRITLSPFSWFTSVR